MSVTRLLSAVEASKRSAQTERRKIAAKRRKEKAEALHVRKALARELPGVMERVAAGITKHAGTHGAKSYTHTFNANSEGYALREAVIARLEKKGYTVRRGYYSGDPGGYDDPGRSPFYELTIGWK